MPQKGLNTWDVHKIINESPNLAKWNPNLAIDWMEEIKNAMQNEVMIKRWNQAAKKINFTIDFSEKYGKVNYEEYWGHKLAKSRRLTFINT